MWLAAAILIVVLNTCFGIWRLFNDLVAGRLTVALLGLGCLLGINAIIGWLIYIPLSSSTDL